MKLRYYLRGLGLGMIVAAAFLAAVYQHQGAALSDREIMSRAADLGMTMPETAMLATQTSTQDATATETAAQETKVTAAADSGQAALSSAAETVSAAESTTTKESAAKESTAVKESAAVKESTAAKESIAAMVTLTVAHGDDSSRVARKAAAAGLVPDAAAFDAYLCQNGYDRRISAGTYEIASGATQEEIARKITGR